MSMRFIHIVYNGHTLLFHCCIVFQCVCVCVCVCSAYFIHLSTGEHSALPNSTASMSLRQAGVFTYLLLEVELPGRQTS